MEVVQVWGLELIAQLQQYQYAALTNAIIVVTALGSGGAYLLLIPLLVWSVGFEFGVCVLIAYSSSSFLNAHLKALFHMPRPYVLEPSLQLVYAGGYGFPSGHAQHAATVWATIAWLCRRRRMTWLAAIAILSIGCSRVYLGVHFPTDVLAGWLVGGALFGVLVLTRSHLDRALRSTRNLAVIAGAVLIVLIVVPSDDVAVALGLVLGALAVGAVPAVGGLLEPGGTLRQRMLRYVVGIGPAALAIVARHGFPDSLELPATVASYFFYTCWVLRVAPALFVRLGLMEASPTQ